MMMMFPTTTTTTTKGLLVASMFVATTIFGGNIIVATAAAAEPTYVDIFYDSFENGWDHFNNGGEFTTIQQQYSYYGSHSVRIRNGSTGQATTESDDFFDVDGYDEILVAFRFFGAWMSPGEYFTFQSSVDGGNTWTVEKSFVSGENNFLTNKEWYWPHITIPVTEGVTTMRIAFQCHADQNWNRVYIDDIAVAGLIYEDESTEPTESPSDSPSGTPSLRPIPGPTTESACVAYLEYGCIQNEDSTDNCCDDGSDCIEMSDGIFQCNIA